MRRRGTVRLQAQARDEGRGQGQESLGHLPFLFAELFRAVPADGEGWGSEGLVHTESRKPLKRLKSQPRAVAPRLSGVLMRGPVSGQPDIVGLESMEFALVNEARAGGDSITERIGGVVAAKAVIVRVGFQDVFRAIGIVLERRQTFDEAGAALVDEKPCGNARGRITKVMEDFAPAVDAVGVGGAQGNAERGVLPGDGGAVALTAEDIGASDEAGEDTRLLMADS